MKAMKTIDLSENIRNFEEHFELPHPCSFNTVLQMFGHPGWSIPAACRWCVWHPAAAGRMRPESVRGPCAGWEDHMIVARCWTTSIFQIPSWGSWSHFLEGNTHVKVVKGTSTVMAGEVVTQQWNSSWAFSTVTGCTRQLRGCSILLFCTLDLGQLNPKSLPSTDPYLTEVPTQCWSTLGECFCPSCLEDPTVPQAVNSARFPVICPS